MINDHHLTKEIMIRLTPKQMNKITYQATKKGLGKSTYARLLIIKDL